MHYTVNTINLFELWLRVDYPMSQHMSRHYNAIKNIQQTTQQKTLNATYDIGNLVYKKNLNSEKQYLKFVFHIFLLKELNVVCCISVSIMSRHLSCFMLYVVSCCVFGQSTCTQWKKVCKNDFQKILLFFI